MVEEKLPFTSMFGCLKADEQRRSLYTSRYPVRRFFEEARPAKNVNVKKKLLHVPPPMREQTMNSCVLETVCTCAAMLNSYPGAWKMPKGGTPTTEVMVYDSIEAYTRARLSDLDPNTDPPNDVGTYPWAGFQIAVTGGLSRMVRPGVYETPDVRDGFQAFYWCQTIQELIEVFRDAKKPAGLALMWYESYNFPIFDNGDFVIDGFNRGRAISGHMVTGRGFVDELAADGIYLRNSWGKCYPGRVRITLDEMGFQLANGAEIVVPIDNPWRT